MMQIFNRFNISPEQNKIIEDVKGPVRVISGPGSGKTMTMVLKYLHLLYNCSTDPAEVLFLTFTNKAANEITDRILEYSAILGVDIDYPKMNVSTIHSFCKAILDDNPDLHGNRPSFDILDEIGQATVLLRLAEDYMYKSSVGACREIVENIIPYINKITDENLSTKAVYNYLKGKLVGISSLEDKEINKIKNAIHLNALYPIYEQTINDLNFIDFGHMQRLVYEQMLSNPVFLSKLRSKYKYILIDEFQDTSFLQNAILLSISEPLYNFTVCGDDDQAIYRFRGATVQNFLSLSDRVSGLKSYYLSTNYRANKNLVEFSNLSIKNNERYRLPKTIVSSSEEEGLISIERHATVDDEINVVINTIENFIKNGDLLYGQIAILFRSINNFALALVKKLREKQIPYTVRGIDKYESSSVIKSVVSILDYLVDKKCNEINLIDNSLFTNDLGIETYKPEERNNVGISEDDLKYAKSLQQIKDKIASKEYHSNLSIYYDILNNNTIVKDWIKEEDYGNLQDIGYLSNVFNLFDTIHKRTDPYLLNALIKSLVMKGIEDSASDTTDAIQIMTIHQAKGLEFPCVVMPNLIKTPTKLNKFCLLDELFNYEVKDSSVLMDVDERKVFYVGITRAQNVLLLSYSDRSLNGKKQTISPYLKDLEHLTNGNIPTISKIQKKEKNSLILSFSQIKTYLDCPRKYYLLYVAKLATVQQAEVYFGLSIHRALDEMHKLIQGGYNLSTKELTKILQSNWISIFRRKKDDKDLFDRGLQYINNYYTNESLYLSNRIVNSEMPFKHLFKKQNVYVNGIIDLIVKNDDNTLTIIDFKISNIDVPIYATQMQLYGNIVDSMNIGKIASLELYSVAEAKRKSISFDGNDVNRIEEIVGYVSESIHLAKWNHTTNHGSCRSCPYKSLCERHSS
jgi:DNA helicase-2/ATP-dependent DNA helicase PcrA